MKSPTFFSTPLPGSTACLSVLMLCLLSAPYTSVAHAADDRQLVQMPPPAREAMRQEMIENLVALNEILALVGTNQFKEAGEIAEQKLGLSARGKHAKQPFDARPGPHMPPDMHRLGMDGHSAASEFAEAAKAGERDRALALLPGLTNACVACHASWRTR